MSAGNGTPRPLSLAEVAARYEENTARQIRELHEGIEAEAYGRVELEREVEASRQRERRLRKALAAFEAPEPAKPGRPKSEPKASKARTPQSINPQVADEILEVIRRLIAETESDVVTRKQVTEAMSDRSVETVRRGLNLLREQERVRLAGTEGQGPRATRLYALMPDAV